MIHNDTPVRPKGAARITLQRKGHTYRVRCIMVEGAATPLLSLKSSQIKILDSDSIHTNKDQPVYKPTTVTDPVLDEYHNVFDDGLGCLAGEYKIRIQPHARSIVQPPCKAPVSLRDAIKEELTKMTVEGVIIPVIKPTEWVSSMVAVKKKNATVKYALTQ